MSQKILFVLLIIFYILSRSLIMYQHTPFPDQDDLYSVKADRIRAGTYFIALDEAKYLALASVFPTHRLFGEIYLAHPPLYPAAIWAADVFHDRLPMQGVCISWLASIGVMVMFIFFLKSFGLRGNTFLVAFFLFTVFELPRMYAQLIMKEEFFLLCFLSAVTFYKYGLERGRSMLLISAVMSLAAAWSADQGLFLVPVLLAAWYCFSTRKYIFYEMVAPLTCFSGYMCWLGIRYYFYTHHELLACGVDGTIERVSQFGIRQLFNPHLFPNSAALMNFKFQIDVPRIFYRLNELFTLSSPYQNLNFIFQLILLFLSLCGIGSMFRPLKVEHWSPGAGTIIYQRTILFFLILLAISFSPLLNRGTQARMMMTVLLAIPIVASCGLRWLGHIFPPAGGGRRRDFFLILLFCCVFFLICGTFMSTQGILFKLDFEFETAKTAAYLKTRPEKVILAQPGYPPELAYLTGKHVVALPRSMAMLQEYLSSQKESLLLFGEHYLGSVNEPEKVVLCRPVIEELIRHPNLFPQLVVIHENYHAVHWPDRITVLRVNEASFKHLQQ
ncbi:hypothetical protein ACFL27_01215 [candidate division CSSED10-310 bacterium]|uniref:Glycosyltransferase RgtA/B/C/D-like domain-containing protein n=1 Tax=candidate division CSSED10-310 bacterium TaxID=2855610 RepID=A0ABV6YRH4_UNCC1